MKVSKAKLAIPAVAIAVAGVALAGCGGSTATGGQVAATIKADECVDSGFYIENRLDSSKETVYNCTGVPGHKRMLCVTYSNGIAENITEEARWMFEDTLTEDKPDCIK